MIQNVEAEAALLGAMLFENDLIDRAADKLEPEDFDVPVHGRIFSAIVREASLGKRVSAITIKGYFENDDGLKVLGGPGYLARLSSNQEGLFAFREFCDQIADLATNGLFGFAAAFLACCAEAIALSAAQKFTLLIDDGDLFGHQARNGTGHQILQGPNLFSGRRATIDTDGNGGCRRLGRIFEQLTLGHGELNAREIDPFLRTDGPRQFPL